MVTTLRDIQGGKGWAGGTGSLVWSYPSALFPTQRSGYAF